MIKLKSLFTIFLFLLIGCGEKRTLPQDKLNYIGTWKSSTSTLTITENARIHYELDSGATLDAPIHKFVGNDLEILRGNHKIIYKIEKVPYLENGVWKMIFEGTEITKQAE